MIKCLYEYDLGEKTGQVRSVPVSMGAGREPAVLFIHSKHPNLDPWSEAFNFPHDTLKLSLYTQSGKRLWQRDLGWGIVPGIWFTPVISFDLDGDGVDEIWYMGNTNERLPMTIDYRVLEKIDPLTGETVGRWPWPVKLKNETMSHTYRFTIGAGYAHGEPVLITMQGTYTDMYLQAYNKDMSTRWEVFVPKDAPGARASHVYPTLDINGDGVDELFWGERVLSVDDGHELFCCDRDGFLGHSDIVIPFYDPETLKKYIFTCREGYDKPGVKRVATFDDSGNKIWESVDRGHIHKGWVANIGENRRRVSMAMSLAIGAKGSELHRSTPTLYYYDSVTGEPVDFKLPYSGDLMMPIDFDGDGYHEFYIHSGPDAGRVLNHTGELIDAIDFGGIVRSGKLLDLPGQQLMISSREEGKVRIWADPAAKDSVPGPNYDGYHKFMQHLMGSGYNHINSVQSCGM